MGSRGVGQKKHVGGICDLLPHGACFHGAMLLMQMLSSVGVAQGATEMCYTKMPAMMMGFYPSASPFTRDMADSHGVVNKKNQSGFTVSRPSCKKLLTWKRTQGQWTFHFSIFLIL